jgi:hypothetical protein
MTEGNIMSSDSTIICIDSSGVRYAAFVSKSENEVKRILGQIDNFGSRMFQKATKPITVNVIEEDLTEAVWSK